MTSVFMVLELSGNYSIIVLVMISNTIAYLIARNYQSVPLFDMLAREDGVHLPSMEEEREQETLRVEDAMRPAGGAVVEAEDSVNTAFLRTIGRADHFLLVRYQDGRWTGIDADALQALTGGGEGSLPLGEIYTNLRMPVLHPDQPLDLALQKIGDWPVLPVVSRADFRKLEGQISVDDILRAYRSAARVPSRIPAEDGSHTH